MAKLYKNVNGVRIEMSADEQAAWEAQLQADADADAAKKIKDDAETEIKKTKEDNMDLLFEFIATLPNCPQEIIDADAKIKSEKLKVQ